MTATSKTEFRGGPRAALAVRPFFWWFASQVTSASGLMTQLVAVVDQSGPRDIGGRICVGQGPRDRGYEMFLVWPQGQLAGSPDVLLSYRFQPQLWLHILTLRLDLWMRGSAQAHGRGAMSRGFSSRKVRAIACGSTASSLVRMLSDSSASGIQALNELKPELCPE